ncbi:BfmA/BtgA family mobilization protein [Myroides odoratimimus]|uniref:BfmA/BtgA family mobilization protein n=1 Tax=Myroides odoratimimus TaxID=76832 RepID=UPI002DBFCA6A|nr:BfmA/BtgA family mobilization protein [Myroides odoratimimus]MEC4052600.1 BfmA/BtgA family mobilization protein [Myroides odoratimimus]
MQNFKDTSIRIKGLTKNKLDKICKEYQYKKINDCVVDMIDFFIQNGLSPQSKINLNLQASLDKINKDFIKRDDSFRKWFGDLYFKKINKLITVNEHIAGKVSVLLDIAKGELIEELRSEFKETEKRALVQDNCIKDKDSYFKLLDSKGEIIKREEETNKLLTQRLKLLLDKVEKKSSFSSSYTIKLSKDELEDLQRAVF